MTQPNDSSPPTLIGAAQHAALRDLGYVGGRRVHLMPPWEASAGEHQSCLVARIAQARPEADLVILAYPVSGASLPLAPAGVRVVFAHRAAGRAPATDPAVRIAVDEAALTDAEQLLMRLGYGPCTHASALALAGFWNSPPDLGSDIVIVLAEPPQERRVQPAA